MSTTLDTSDRHLLEQAEQVIERGLATFVDVGRALLGIRDGRLYRDTDGDFETYCQRRWSMGKPQAHRMIVAAEVVREVVPIGTVPQSESVARELAPLRQEPEQMREAWAEAVEQHGPEPTAAQVREIVRRPEPVAAVSDPAESFFANGMRAERERQSELYRVQDAVKPCRRIDWEAFSGQVVGLSTLDRKLLENSAAILEETARQVRALLTTKLEVVK